jgi:hypothetical protein
MERPLLIFTVEDLVLALALLVAVALGYAALRQWRGPPGAHSTNDEGMARPEGIIGPAHDQLRALEAIEARTLRAVADHRMRIQAMRQQLAHGTAEEQKLLSEVERLTFAAIAEQHDRALREALATEGDGE